MVSPERSKSTNGIDIDTFSPGTLFELNLKEVSAVDFVVKYCCSASYL